MSSKSLIQTLLFQFSEGTRTERPPEKSAIEASPLPSPPSLPAVANPDNTPRPPITDVIASPASNLENRGGGIGTRRSEEDSAYANVSDGVVEDDEVAER